MDQVLDAYLDRIDRHLRPMPASERVDIVQEIRSELLELEAQGLSGEKEEGQHQGQRQSGTADAVDKAMCGHARHPI